MNHWIMFPLLIPAVVAPLLILTGRYDEVLSRVFSVGGMVLQLLVAIVLAVQAFGGEIVRYELGNWPEPYGIVLVLDRLAATMLLLAAVIGLLVALVSIDNEDEQGRHFHPLLLLQMLGLNGAFLAGDLFNLFVFFEVMLIAAYGLASHGGGRGRLAASFQFVAINLLGSTLFLIGIGLIYAVTGELNLRELGQRLSAVPEAQRGLLSCGIAVIVAVFSLKSAVFPFHFWLPATYSRSAPVIVALFGVTTKVGIYSLLRFYASVLAGNEACFSPWVLSWVFPAGVVTVVLGALGVVAARGLAALASFAMLSSGGVLAMCVAGFEPERLGAGLYYMVHSTIAGACLFFVVEGVIRRRRDVGDALSSSQPFVRHGLLGAGFFVAAIAVVGMPPLSGFVGKLLVLDSFKNSPWHAASWSTILGTSLIGLVGFARAGSVLFWKTPLLDAESSPNESRRIHTVMTFIAIGILVALLAMMSVFAGVIAENMRITTEQLLSGRVVLDG